MWEIYAKLNRSFGCFVAVLMWFASTSHTITKAQYVRRQFIVFFLLTEMKQQSS